MSPFTRHTTEQDHSSMSDTRIKQYVEVIAQTHSDGSVTPLDVILEDGRAYHVNCVKEVRRAASTKVGGIGLRYRCDVEGSETYLFYEDPRWFVEGKKG